MNRKKPKAIIFGSGGGGKKLYNNCKFDFKFVAYSDNDASMHGKIINNLQVVKPEDIKDINYDLIIVASMWVREIKDQLISSGIPKEKIYIPKKNLLKHGNPFADVNTRKFARKTIFNITEFAEINGINIYIDCGTLLGFAREGNILEWDDDIDMALCDCEFEKFEKLLPMLKIHLPVFETMVWRCFLFLGQDNKRFGVSIECLSAKGRVSKLKPFDIFIQSYRRKYGFFSPIGGAFANLNFPEEFFNGYDELVFHDGTLKAPRGHDNYLKKLYGDWKTPRKNQNFTSYSPVSLASFDNKVSFSLQKKAIF